MSLRAAQDLTPEGLPTFGDASETEARLWLLEQIYADEIPGSIQLAYFLLRDFASFRSAVCFAARATFFAPRFAPSTAALPAPSRAAALD